MGRIDILREESLEDIIFEIECLNFFANMKKKYRHTRLGFEMAETHQIIKLRLSRLVRRHKKEFGESVDIKILREM
jgi:hypothetical protein